uniref:Cyclin-like domain-containing protein n=1 Tax=Tanacetum cinerariifolium TaxID=118510 RepID=A0A699HG57_TANCI|nr:hypothetical protein [Tanacetum cinerariifolium]
MSSIHDSIIEALIVVEPRHSPFLSYHLSSVHLTHRQDSIHWILRACARYHFQPTTIALSVNYFDRFFPGSATLEGYNDRDYRLLSIVCLSLAAKMEESNIPSLVNLQVSEPRFIFESKIIQEMELSVMKKLNWRLLSVTPYDFINYFIFKLPSSCIKNEVNFRMQCSDLIIKTIQVIEFSRFQSFVIAATTVTIVVGDDVKLPESFYEKVNKVLIIT